MVGTFFIKLCELTAKDFVRIFVEKGKKIWVGFEKAIYLCIRAGAIPCFLLRRTS